MSEIDYLIKDLEQRRSAVNRELQRIKAQHSEVDNPLSEQARERVKRLEGRRDWLNRSIEKLLFQPDSAISNKTSFFAF